MKRSNVISVVAAMALGAVVAGTAVVAAERSSLHHPEPFTLAQPGPAAPPVLEPSAAPSTSVLQEQLQAAAQNPALGVLHGRVTNTATGEVVWQNLPEVALTPASATKVLTASAALQVLDENHRITTTVHQAQPGTVVIRAQGDVWLDEEALDALAESIGPQDAVLIDNSAWVGPLLANGVEESNVDGGYIAPMQPAMLHGARLGAPSGDVPRSHTPALDVAQALADRVGAQHVDYGQATGTVVASHQSPPLYQRLEDMVKHSDNVMAEAIGREVAIASGFEPSFAGSTAATLAALEDFDTSAVHLEDNSGMSEENLINPALLDSIVSAAVQGTQLRPLLGLLPVASGEGTLEDRYQQLPGQGWVRAKTGTLTGVNALVGTATGTSGTVYSFALLSNEGGNTLEVRRGLDEFASLLRAG